jgi:hypothetical protein
VTTTLVSNRVPCNNPLVCKLRHVGAERQSSSYGLNVLERSRDGNDVGSDVDVPHTRAEYSQYAMERVAVWLTAYPGLRP